MPFNGSGVFSRLYSWVNDAANSINIKADRMDAEMDGFASGLSNCLTRDGQGKPSAAIDWNGQNLSNVAALSANSASIAGTASLAGAVNFGATFSLASAATVNIGAAAAYSGTISGITTITAFDNVVAGIIREVTFSGALTLTHNATSLILPGGANITTAGGDCATFLSLGAGNWRCIKYQYATATAARAALGIGLTPQVRNLTGNVNATTPLTKFDLSCDFVTLRDANGATVTLYGPHSRTVDLGLAGSVVNGRDQAAAFAANSWVHLYWIWNGTTLGLIASLSATAGPTLPSGYTHWCYATTIRWNASSNIIPVFVRGCTCTYDLASGGVNRVLGAGVATAFTAVSLASFVPTNALRVMLNASMFYIHTAAGVEFAGYIRPTGSAAAGVVIVDTVSQVANIAMNQSNSLETVAGTSQQIDYKINAVPATSGGLTLDVLGFVVPNGDA